MFKGTILVWLWYVLSGPGILWYRKRILTLKVNTVMQQFSSKGAAYYKNTRRCETTRMGKQCTCPSCDGIIVWLPQRFWTIAYFPNPSSHSINIFTILLHLEQLRQGFTKCSSKRPVAQSYRLWPSASKAGAESAATVKAVSSQASMESEPSILTSVRLAD